MKFVYYCFIASFIISGFSACGGGAGSALGPHSVETSTQHSACPGLISGPARGLACLHCTQPQAREQANIIARLMNNSCLLHPATAYLVDNTFAYDESLLIKHARLLSQGGRTPVLTYYLGNGPAQRRFDITEIQGFGAMISPQEFRERIQNDQALREEYKALVRRITPVLREAVAQGAVVILVPMLEDNLSDLAYLAMRDLTLQALPSDLPVAIGRSICSPNCFEGNEGLIPAGVVPEIHQGRPPVTVRGGTISNDGFDYTSPAFPGNDDARFTLDEMRTLRDEASALGNTFILWSAERQGIPPEIEVLQFPNPAQRNYVVPSEAEQQELLGFLREGL